MRLHKLYRRLVLLAVLINGVLFIVYKFQSVPSLQLVEQAQRQDQLPQEQHKKDPIREENTPKLDLKPLHTENDEDDAEEAVEPELNPDGLPSLSPDLVLQAQAELQDMREGLENPRLALNDAKHAQGFTRHVEGTQDHLLDPGLDSKPILYNRLRSGKISNMFVEREDLFQIPIDYKFNNPLQKLRELPRRSTQLTLPKIQVERLAPQDLRYTHVRNVFLENWKQYFYFSKKFDSFKPLTLTGTNDYIGWCLTLVDSLDTLFVMGFVQEFELAVSQIYDLDFFHILRDDVPTFEVNIRVLGGLLGAYDLSNDERLLDKARDIAHILIRAFDTENQMPLMYLSVKPSQRDRPKYASLTNYLSEVGSLSLEFTRLSIITKDMTFFTYVMNLLDQIIESKDDFLIKGLIPNELDLSGCKQILRDDDVSRLDSGMPAGATEAILTYDLDDDNELVYCVAASKSEKQIRPLSLQRQVFSMEGKSDSFYEYLLKLHHLLNGNWDDKYIDFYKTAKEKIKKFLIFKPKLPQKEGAGEMVFLNEITVTDMGNKELELTQHNRVSHLSCFAGGLFSMSGRLLKDHADIETGELLTRSCSTLASKYGVFPESLMVQSCDNLEKCEYDEADRIKYIKKHTSSENVDYVRPKTVETKIQDNGIVYNIKTSSKIPYSPYDELTRIWKTGEAANQPLELDDIDPRHLLRPELIESMFIYFRITGDEMVRDQLWELFQKTIEMSNGDVLRDQDSESVQASVRDITSGESSLINELESWWFAETLKYYYLIFQDSKMLSLDEWVFNTEGHPLKKEKYWLEG